MEFQGRIKSVSNAGNVHFWVSVSTLFQRREFLSLTCFPLPNAFAPSPHLGKGTYLQKAAVRISDTMCLKHISNSCLPILNIHGGHMLLYEVFLFILNSPSFSKFFFPMTKWIHNITSCYSIMCFLNGLQELWNVRTHFHLLQLGRRVLLALGAEDQGCF